MRTVKRNLKWTKSVRNMAGEPPRQEESGPLVDFAKKMWGYGTSKTFRLASWAAAFSMAGAWWYIEDMQKPPYMRSIEPTPGPYKPSDKPYGEK